MFIEIALSETISAEFKLRRVFITEIGIKYTQWVKVCNMVTANLICTDEQLDLVKCQSQSLGAVK